MLIFQTDLNIKYRLEKCLRLFQNAKNYIKLELTVLFSQVAKKTLTAIILMKQQKLVLLNVRFKFYAPHGRVQRSIKHEHHNSIHEGYSA